MNAYLHRWWKMAGWMDGWMDGYVAMNTIDMYFKENDLNEGIDG